MLRVVQQQAESASYGSLVRGLAVLEAIGEGSTTVTRLAERFGVDKSTMSRVLTALERHGWVSRRGSSLKLGPRAVVLGAGSDERRIVRAAERRVEQVAKATGCDVIVSVLGGERGYQLASSSGLRRRHDYPGVVDPFPIWSNAGGQVMAAQLTDGAIRRLLPAEPFPKWGPNTLTTCEQLFARLDGIRQLGYAVELEEMAVGVGCVAVRWAIGDQRVGAIACVSEVEHVRANLDHLRDVLIAAAASNRRDDGA